MQIVIDIPEEKYELIKKQVADGITNPLKICIANGTPIPEHGRLIDADAITKDDNTFCESFERVMDAMTGRSVIVCIAPTILEAWGNEE